ncbi:GDP-mannose 4,6-dehydratase [Patescibacteria group bacterium]|nr:GDP-mannose 4,6-dehydratase [Patescibacteria group bacterium]MBU1682849.1 GDP-mannose 4,6-dehydratase [Patescibacteria group bacterium]MBU1934800.1 GDP-mannose 4,6-dehydratase [Patescibacteria group bacterium]
MKTLVTGGAGFIGSHVINHLLNETDYQVVCIDNFNDYYDPAIKEKNITPFLDNKRFKLYRTDICDCHSDGSGGMNKIFVQEKPDKIIHLAARAGVRDSIENPLLYKQVNLDGTKNLLELAKDFNVKNFVFASSSSIYGNQEKTPFSETDIDLKPISFYGETKKEGEEIARKYHESCGLPITCLRFFTVYGPAGRPDMAPYKFTKLINEGEPIPKFGEGNTKRDYTYIDDIVAGIIAALEKNLPFEIINLGNNQVTSLNEFIALIEKLVGKKAIINQLPMQPGDVDITYADISKAQKLLGYTPKTSAEEGMEKFVNWYLQKFDTISSNSV